MTDKEKLDAIRAEIHRLVDVRGYDREMANDLFAFMDSLQNEPKDKCQGCNNVKGCIICVDGSEWAHIEEFVDTEEIIHEIDPEHKVCPITDLEQAAIEYFKQSLFNGNDSIMQAFKAGAKWKKKQVTEKAAEFFENDLCCYIKAQCFTIEHGRLENDFRKHIEED